LRNWKSARLKWRKDREVTLHFAPYPIQLILGKKDPVLNFEDNLEQIEGTQVQLTTFEDGHMSHFENYKKHLEQNGEEIVKIGDRDLIDLFKNDVEQARLESLKLQSPERNSSSDAPKNSQTAQEVKDSQSEISQVSPKSGSNSQTKTSPNSAQSQAASQSESTKPQSQASSSAQPKFTESKNATNPQSDNSNERPTSSNNLPLIFTLAGGIILSVMAFVALKKR
jgi:thiol:disulfide interchange protein